MEADLKTEKPMDWAVKRKKEQEDTRSMLKEHYSKQKSLPEKIDKGGFGSGRKKGKQAISETTSPPISEIQSEIDAGKVTYRGAGANSDKTKLTVKGKEYTVGKDVMDKLQTRDSEGSLKIRFKAPYRKG